MSDPNTPVPGTMREIAYTLGSNCYAIDGSLIGSMRTVEPTFAYREAYDAFCANVNRTNMGIVDCLVLLTGDKRVECRITCEKYADAIDWIVTMHAKDTDDKWGGRSGEGLLQALLSASAWYPEFIAENFNPQNRHLAGMSYLVTECGKDTSERFNVGFNNLVVQGAKYPVQELWAYKNSEPEKLENGGVRYPGNWVPHHRIEEEERQTLVKLYLDSRKHDPNVIRLKPEHRVI